MDRPLKPLKGRGALSNPEGRFESRRVEPVDDGWGTHLEHTATATSETDDRMDDASELPPLETIIRPEPARSIITRNSSPDIAFEQSINPYRGCEHGCVYCASGDTPILMGDGSFKSLGELKVGDEIYGTQRQGHYRRFLKTEVLAHWKTHKPAFKVTLADGTELITSGDHRFLTERGWKFVDQPVSQQRPHLTINNKLMGFGAIAPTRASSCNSAEYRRGYLCGVIRGDGHLGVYRYERAGRKNGDQYRFRLAMIDGISLDRTAHYLSELGVHTDRFLFQKATSNRQHCEAIRTSARAAIGAIEQIIQWPDREEGDWARGFIAGIFDAEGSFDGTVMRIANSDHRIIGVTQSALRMSGFDAVVDSARMDSPKPMHYVRVRGGMREHLRFFSAFGPAITRKRGFVGQAVKSAADLRVVAIEPLSGMRDLFDITTGTGDFIANGVISHNCFARPNHSYVNLSPGLDFETKLFYKQDAAQLLEKELRRKSYVCKPINIGASTDPYQPIERKLNVTRSILEVMQRFRHPITIVTKGHLVERDIDILSDLARDELVMVYVSITTLGAALKRGLEPRAPSPAARLGAVKRLSNAGIPVGVMMAPIIPAVNDHEIERLLEAVVSSGAQWAGHVLLRLPYEVKDLFKEWLEGYMPLRAGHVMSLIRQMRGGQENDPRFGSRMRGQGAYAQLITRRFQAACDRLGLNRGRYPALSTSHFTLPPPETGQLQLL